MARARPDPALAPGAIGLEAEHVRLPAGTRRDWGLMAAHRWLAVIRGHGHLELSETGTRLRPGVVVLVRAGVRHRYGAGANDLVAAQLRLRTRALAPNQNVDRRAAALVAAALAHADRHGGRLRLDPPVLRAVHTRLTGMAALAEDGGPDHQLLLKAELLCLLHALAGQRPIRRELHRGPGPNAVGTAGIKAVLAHIDAHADEPLAVAEAAALAGLGRTRFHRAFKEATGLTLAAYLTRFRVGRAAELLRRTDREILDVAFTCGFGSVSRFYEAFKQELGLPPRAWRQAERGEG